MTPQITHLIIKGCIEVNELIKHVNGHLLNMNNKSSNETCIEMMKWMVCSFGYLVSGHRFHPGKKQKN